MFQRALLLTVLAVFSFSSISAQGQAAEIEEYVRDVCLKVTPGKGAELAKMLHDVGAKLARLRVDEGRASWWSAQRAVVPVGSDARCDYHILYGYPGFPPESLSQEQLSADLKKAGVGMSHAELASRRNDLATVVNLDIWRIVGRVGQGELGSYVVHNLYKAKPGQANEWIRLETEGWMPLAKAYAEEGPGRGWAAAVLAMPAGGDLDYNAITADIFPNWAALGKGVGAAERWPKIHPGISFTDYFSLFDNVRTVHKRQVFEVVGQVRGE